MIIIPAIIEHISSRKDNTIRIVIGTQELSPLNAGELFSLANSMCFVGFKHEQFNQAERDTLGSLHADAEETNFKTPSQRLRAVLFRLWEHHPEGFKTFATFYEHHMERITNHFKTKIDQ